MGRYLLKGQYPTVRIACECVEAPLTLSNAAFLVHVSSATDLQRVLSCCVACRNTLSLVDSQLKRARGFCTPTELHTFTFDSSLCRARRNKRARAPFERPPLAAQLSLRYSTDTSWLPQVSCLCSPYSATCAHRSPYSHAPRPSCGFTLRWSRIGDAHHSIRGGAHYFIPLVNLHDLGGIPFATEIAASQLPHRHPSQASSPWLHRTRRISPLAAVLDSALDGTLRRRVGRAGQDEGRRHASRLPESRGRLRRRTRADEPLGAELCRCQRPLLHGRARLGHDR